MSFERYDHAQVEQKWQARWLAEKAFSASNASEKPKFYVLVEFPYPSGAGLHVGHVRSYAALDAVARKRRMQGYNVLFPMGWDAFGLPAENYALKTGIHPSITTQENINTFRRQLQSIGLSFDWDREVDTTDPKYYRWTQWMFLEFFRAGLAYKAKMAINWCPKDKCGLANEEVVAGACERCGTPVEKREKEQWMIAITKYADRLLTDLDTVNYLPKIKKQQQEWIGKSVGAEIDFALVDVNGEPTKQNITVFTTRPDTLFGVTYVVLAPEHPLAQSITVKERLPAVRTYIADAAKKSEADRGDATKEKSGVFTGAYVKNPVNGEVVPVWIGDYVLAQYGTGAVMAVPEHDERDRAFAQKFELPIVDRPLVAFDEAVAKANGRKTVKYKIRDWVFSRQRYWGEPIPLVRCHSVCDAAKEHGGWVAVPDASLPVTLPEVEKYQPTDNGESPLATISEFVNTTCPSCGGPATRETDTMPQWAGSSWYFLRYIDAHNDQAFASKQALNYWMPVDLYNGGMEHTTLHLLYSRFWNKFLFDRGHVPHPEPYARRHSHGLVMASDGSKMSKSKGNVVNPDDITKEFGADTLRIYELFMGPFEEPVPWSENGVIGVRRFLDKVYRFVATWNESQKTSSKASESAKAAPTAADKLLQKTIKKVGDDIEAFKFNTAISALMILVNELDQSFSKSQVESLLRMLSPFAPHLANELWEMIGNTGLVESEAWPQVDESLLVESEVKLIIQVNGKMRGSVMLKLDASQDEAVAAAKADANVQSHLQEKNITKVIHVPNRLLNIVVE